ncbi:hypothetical protein [Siphonobacter aquaeclarae]|uniref:TfoX N-terminal domain-containing protein n=1 Tax=Siphonobacter aquaeclarae TaxID=563176 RepID=A0A1G9ID98_9BACT|nr:hypothetical protein [Siphonobacter aquaeclarae]SDL23210.1 hypothetical protein SAMN04488090_0435 [Siphonobacter aquaeclarae]
MTLAETRFHEIAAQLPEAVKGKMFGALCLKAPNGKAALMVWHGFMIFKLDKPALNETLSLDGAQLFTPMEGRPMNGWVQLDASHADRWESLAGEAFAYVRTLEK